MRRWSSQLTPAERFGCALGWAMNETQLGKGAATLYGDVVTNRWLSFMTSRLIHMDGASNLPVGSAFILAANHRTFFDMFATLVGIWPSFDPKPYVYCPVRSEFFYEKRRGALFNLLVTGGCMYPPVFRDARGPQLNDNSVEACVRLLTWSPRTLICLHPEGRRNKSADPYALLPGKPGVGRMALNARAPVVPMFINGLKPKFGAQVRSRNDTGPESEVRIFIGAPTELSDLYDRPQDPAAQQLAADRVMADIAACGVRERAYFERSSAK